MTSTSGENWSTVSSGTTQGLGAVKWVDTQFVAIGDGGTILTSPNGTDWTSRNSGTSEGLRTLDWNDGVIVVAGNSGTILTSQDAQIWMLRESGVSEGIQWLVWTGAQFWGETLSSPPVESGVSLLSQDGLDWTQNVGGSFFHAVRIGRQIVGFGPVTDAFSESIMDVSGEGSSWSKGMGTSQFVRAVAWTGSRLVVVGDGGTILTMP